MTDNRTKLLRSIFLLRFWRQRSFWGHEFWLAFMFAIICAVAYLKAGEFLRCVKFFFGFILFMQPFLIVAHLFDVKFENPNKRSVD